MVKCLLIALLVGGGTLVATGGELSTREVKSLWPTSGESGSMRGLHGFIYMAKDWKTPNLPPSTPVDIAASSDNARIAVLLLPYGPIYTSTNAGTTWTIISVPGTYSFPISTDSSGRGIYASDTIYPTPTNQTPANSASTNWYAVTSSPDGSKLVVGNDSSQPAPVIRIAPTNGGVVVSWPTNYGNYVLQGNSNLDPANWTSATNAATVSGDENQVFVPSPASNDFYRLRIR